MGQRYNKLGRLSNAIMAEANDADPNKPALQYPYIEAEVLFSVAREYALHPEDILARRTRLAFLDRRAAISALDRVVDLMATSEPCKQVLRWTDEDRNREEARARDYIVSMTQESKELVGVGGAGIAYTQQVTQ
eukprot:GEZU01008855.1.p1 GENE.GEZU01008855.1~~GEZU01008855.1.p1  ORF type:complete len:134 (+),score=15.67 GEZU01008855.1:95-496(+)